MTKIPEDIIKAGRRCYDGLGRGSVSDSEHIARAILAERERCAKVAEDLEIVTVEPERTYTERDDFGDAYAVTIPERRSRRILGGKVIAAAIRKGSDK